MSLLVFSDLHGNYQAWDSIANYIDRSPPNTKVICLGDFIDRGNNSVEIVEQYAQAMLNYPNKYFFILGNHELSLQRFLLESERNQTEWFDNGGATLCKELKDETDENIELFLIAFTYLMLQGYARCYVRTKHLYVLTHAGATDNILNPHHMRRVWSRMDAISQAEGNYGIQRDPIPDGREVLCLSKERFGRRLDFTHRKYYVFGHTPTRIEVIDSRWNTGYGDYRHAFLPLDAGLARAYEGERGQTVVGEIGLNTHRAIVFPGITGVTPINYLDVDFRRAMTPTALRIKDIFVEKILSDLEENVEELNAFMYTYRRTFAISWVEDWIRTNFRLIFSTEMDKFYLDKTSRDWESFYGAREEFLDEPEIFSDPSGISRRSPTPRSPTHVPPYGGGGGGSII